jgi:iron only hydrogenase large subunit-like protein
MPCLDKKLESARTELSSPGQGQDTDCVLTAAEMLQFVRECQQDGTRLEQMTNVALDSLAGLTSSRVEVSRDAPYHSETAIPVGMDASFTVAIPENMLPSMGSMGSDSGTSGAHAFAVGGLEENASSSISVADGGSSGGYLEAVARSACMRILGLRLPEKLIFNTPKSTGDVRELRVEGPSGELRFAAVYGFRYIQTLAAEIEAGIVSLFSLSFYL